MRPLRWAVVLVDFEPGVVGHEQQGERRALVVSYEAFHASGLAAVCPMSSRAPKYAGEIPIPKGHAGQTKEGVVLCHQIWTIDQSRITAWTLGGQPQYVTDPAIRQWVRSALLHHLALDIPDAVDGAA